jgi:hypothetical protein
MKILIAIPSCRRNMHNGFNQAVRDTWLKDIEKYPDVEYRFFIGDGTPVPADVDAAIRASEIKGFSDTNRGIDYSLKTTECESVAAEPIGELKSDEVLIPVPDDYRYLAVKVQETFRWAHEHGFDFVYKCDTDTYAVLDRLLASDFRDHDLYGGTCGDNICGGGGYWISRKAIELLLDKKVNSWAEDCWLSGCLRAQGIKPRRDERYGDAWVSPKNRLISTHVGWKSGYDTARMYSIHRRMRGDFPKVLIAVSGWVVGATNGDHQAIRDTWGKEVENFPNLDYKIFIGDGTPVSPEDDALLLPSLQHAAGGHKRKAITTKNQEKTSYVPKDDELLVPCPDGYLYMGHKTWHSHRWALDQGYEYIFQCFPDTFIDVDKLMTSGFEEHPFIGAPISGGSKTLKFAAGGCGYWLDRQATEIVLETRPNDWAEDRWVGNALATKGITLWHDNRYGDARRQPRANNEFITEHLCDTPKIYDNNWMREAYKNSKLNGEAVAPVVNTKYPNVKGRKAVPPGTRLPIRPRGNGLLVQNWFDTHPRVK